MSFLLQCLSFRGLMDFLLALSIPKALSETHRGADFAFLLAFASFFLSAELLFELMFLLHLLKLILPLFSSLSF